MKPEAILFDLDETLVPEQPATEAALLATCRPACRRLGLDADALVQAVLAQARRLWRASSTIDYCRAIGISSWEGLWGRFAGDDPNLCALHNWAPGYRREAWRSALLELGADDAAPALELAERFPEERRARLDPFPETHDVLAHLAGAYRLGIVTNGAPDLQREKIERADLARYFDVIVVSGDIGIGKPEPGIFAHALDALSVRPERAVMVGDSISRDIAGAQAAGLRAVHVAREDPAAAGGVEPNGRVSDLRQLPQILH